MLDEATRAVVRQETAAQQQRIEELTAQLLQAQAAQAATTPLPGTAADRPQRSLVDSRVGRPPTYKGDEAGWTEWSYKFKAYVSLVSPLLALAMDDAEVHAHAPQWAYMGEVAPDDRAQLQFLLISCCEGPALQVIRAAGGRDGVEAYRLLCRRYNPRTASRTLARLQELMSFSVSAGDALSQLTLFDRKVDEYETWSGDRLASSVKCAILLNTAPPNIRTHLLLTVGEVPEYSRLRASIESYVVAERSWRGASAATSSATASSSAAPVPMEVDVVKGKGKAGGKAGGKTGGKGKEQGKSKGKDKHTTSSSQSSSSAAASAKFAGYCGFCGKWGHKQKDCRSKARGQVAEVSGEAPRDTAATEVTTINALGPDSSDGWVCTVGAFSRAARDSPTEALIDSGCCRHVCGKEDFPEAPLEEATGAMQLFSAQGVPLDTLGFKTVLLCVLGDWVPLCFQVVNVRLPILSVSALSAAGFRTTFSEKGGFITYAASDGPRLRLHRVRGLYYAELGSYAAAPPPASGDEAGTRRGYGHCVPLAAAPLENAARSAGDARGSSHAGGASRPELAARAAESGVLQTGGGEDARPARAPPPRDEAAGDLAPHAGGAIEEHEGYDIRPDLAEDRGARTLAVPASVSEAEREHHDLTHLPYESWCSSCVRGRGREARHLRLESRAGLPTVFVDYGFLRSTSDTSLLKVLVGADDVYNTVFCIPCARKGPSDASQVKSLAAAIRALGLERVNVQSDPEPSVMAVVRAACALVAGATPRSSPVNSKGSNGRAERALQAVQGLLRTLGAHLERKAGVTLSSDMDLTTWAARHAAWLISRFAPQTADKLTAYERQHQRAYHSPVLAFGELVLWKQAASHVAKLSSAWGYGCWVGRSAGSDAHIVGTKQGTVVCRTVKRMPLERRWDGDMLNSMRGTPSQLVPLDAAPAETSELPLPLAATPPQTAVRDDIEELGPRGPPAAERPRRGRPPTTELGKLRAELRVKSERERAEVAQAASPGTPRAPAAAATPLPSAAAPSAPAPLPQQAASSSASAAAPPTQPAPLLEPAAAPDEDMDGPAAQETKRLRVAALALQRGGDPNAFKLYGVGQRTFYEEDSGIKLDSAAVEEGMRREVRQMRQLEVFTEVARVDVRGRIWTTRWCHRLKGEGDDVVVRSRFVVRQYANEGRDEQFYSPTPGLDVFRLLLAKASLYKDSHDAVLLDFGVAFMHTPLGENAADI